ncbi:hypothetical protein EV359DRAFT_64968 [Lentinula novae-zelandiae]|nr:hypothetical protein EV359DRAFT_64968 [Lentinula novae-zelandiae]
MFRTLSTMFLCSLSIVFGSLHMLASIPTSCAAPSKVSPQNCAASSISDHESSIAQPTSNRSTDSLAPLVARAPPMTANIKEKWMNGFWPTEVTPEDEKYYFQSGNLNKYLAYNLVSDLDRNPIRGKFNAGVYASALSYGGYRSDQLVVKVLRQVLVRDRFDDRAYGEVMALKLAGLYVTSGKEVLTTRNCFGRTGTTFRPAIIMKKVEGMPVMKTSTWRRANNATKNKMVNDIKKRIKVQLMDLALEHRILHNDFHSGNIHVVLDKNGTLKEAKLLDYGYPGLLAIDPTTKKEVLEDYFERRWVWGWPRYKEN